MAYTEDFHGENDASLDRTYQIDNNVLHVKKEDPYGFWFCHYEKGPVPEILSGAYTSFEQADRAVRYYIQEKSKTLKATDIKK